MVTRLQAGAGGVALRGALALDPDRYQVTIIAGDTDGIADADGSGDQLLTRAAEAALRVGSLPDLVSPISPRQDVRCLHLLTDHLAQVGYDVVHTHSAKAGALVGWLRNGPGHHASCTRSTVSRSTSSSPGPRRRAYVGVERYLGRRTDVFLAVGGAVAAEAVRRGIAAPERVRVINPAIDWPDAQASAAVRDAARRRLGVPVGCKIVGTVGRADYQKAPESFVDALAALDRPDVYGVWIGDGPLRGEMEQRANRRGLQGRFICVGHRDDVPQLLPGLDVFVLASRYEGLPCAVAEAMMAGLPVVATAVNAVPDVVLPGETGLLATPERPQQLAAAVRYMLDSPADAARMAAAGRRLIADRFTPGALAAVLDAAYGSGVSSPPRPRRYVALAGPA